MATLTLYNATNMTLNGIINYIASDMEHEGLVLHYNAIGADPYRAVRDMLNVKRYYGKLDGNEYIQMILSLEADEVKSNNDIECFITAATDMLYTIFNRYKCQIAYAIHYNTPNLHVHYILNSVRYNDGHKLQIGPEELKNLKYALNEKMRMFGFSEIRVKTQKIS